MEAIFRQELKNNAFWTVFSNYKSTFCVFIDLLFKQFYAVVRRYVQK